MINNKRLRLSSNDNEIDANLLAKLCYQTYNNNKSFGKSGKPNVLKNEYTVLACLIELNDKNQSKSKIICLTTGTKCFPRNLPYSNEDIVDCHAESLLKRAFKCYLIDLIKKWLKQNDNLNEFYEKVLKNRNYCLFISQFPCGLISRYKGNDDDYNTKISVNRKPGRGDYCPKAACIHKIAKWIIFGLQGSKLLALIGKPLSFEHIIIGNCETQEFETISAELDSAKKFLFPNQSECLKISEDFNNFKLTSTCQLHFAQQFRHQEFIRNDFPCGSSIVSWIVTDCDDREKFKVEIIANGRKLGAIKRKTYPNTSGTSIVCDYHIQKNIEQIEIVSKIENRDKNLSEIYKNNWLLAKKQLTIFKNWPDSN